MIDRMAIEAVSRLPMYFDHTAGVEGGHYRKLGRIQTARPKLKMQSFGAFLEAKYGMTAPDMLAGISDFDHWRPNVPVLDQKQIGSCVAHGHVRALTVARDISGATYVALSPDGLYAFIDNGVDEGSDSADAVTAMEKTGVPLLSDVPDNFILLKDIPAAALQAALRFRITPTGVYTFNTCAEGITAMYLGFGTTWTVNVGNNFNPNSDGIAGFTPGFANHCVSGGEGMITINGVKYPVLTNSWAVTWPDVPMKHPGTFLVVPKAIDLQQGFEGVAITSPMLDPQDPLNWPNVV